LSVLLKTVTVAGIDLPVAAVWNLLPMTVLDS